MFDIVVIGGGPAGMTAALYGSRNGKNVLVVEKNSFGGQMTSSPGIENYPGYTRISGNALAEKMLEQILEQGASIDFSEVTGISCYEDCKVISTDDASFKARSVIIASGVKHRMLGLEGEEELVGNGISFCAVCDGDFYTDKEVCVAGGGNSALQEAILLSDKCSKVSIIQDLPHLTGESRLQDILTSRPNVEIIPNQEITALERDESGLVGIEIAHRSSGQRRKVHCDGLFVAIGLIPENASFEDVAALDDYGYFDADERCLTKTEGIFVAGDCRSKEVRQITTAMADGAAAALAACRYIDEL